MAALEYHTGTRGYPGYTVTTTNPSGNVFRQVVPAMALVDPDNPTAGAPGSATNPFSTSPGALTTGTDRSGSITTGGNAQQLSASNTSRRGLVGQNISSGDLWINEIGGTAAVDTAGSYKIPSGQPFSVSTSRAISIIGATAGQKFTATEY